jgi:hypothetical protein
MTYSVENAVPPVAISDAAFGQGSSSMPIWLDDVMCMGGEGSLLDCFTPPFGIHNCAHSEDASVDCTPIATTAATTTVMQPGTAEPTTVVEPTTVEPTQPTTVIQPGTAEPTTVVEPTPVEPPSGRICGLLREYPFLCDDT